MILPFTGIPTKKRDHHAVTSGILDIYDTYMSSEFNFPYNRNEAHSCAQP